MDGYGMNSAESRIGGLASRMEQLDTMSSSGVPYDPAVAAANPVMNPNAGGVSPQQGQGFQAMIQLMQAQMLSGSMGANNDDKNNASGIENMMNNPMFGMMMGGGMQGLGGMNAMPNAGMLMPGMNNGMGTMPGMGMGSIDPALLQQNSQMQMFDNF